MAETPSPESRHGKPDSDPAKVREPDNTRPPSQPTPSKPTQPTSVEGA